MRPLGIPTVSDRIAQMVIRQIIEPKLEPIFDTDSFGYRPGRSAHQAVELCRKRCWNRDWVLDLDIKGFFDSIDHHLLLKALQCHVQERWVMLYLRRWLEAPVQLPNGELQARSLLPIEPQPARHGERHRLAGPLRVSSSAVSAH
jgi:retron-type reverse transcriptase